LIHFISKKEIDAAKIVIIWELGKLGGRCQVSGIKGECHVLKAFLEGAFAKRPYITYSKSD